MSLNQLYTLIGIIIFPLIGYVFPLIILHLYGDKLNKYDEQFNIFISENSKPIIKFLDKLGVNFSKVHLVLINELSPFKRIDSIIAKRIKAFLKYFLIFYAAQLFVTFPLYLYSMDYLSVEYFGFTRVILPITFVLNFIFFFLFPQSAKTLMSNNNIQHKAYDYKLTFFGSLIITVLLSYFLVIPYLEFTNIYIGEKKKIIYTGAVKNIGSFENKWNQISIDVYSKKYNKKLKVWVKSDLKDNLREEESQYIAAYYIGFLGFYFQEPKISRRYCLTTSANTYCNIKNKNFFKEWIK